MCKSILKYFAHLPPPLITYQRHVPFEGELAQEVWLHQRMAQNVLAKGFVGRWKTIEEILREVGVGEFVRQDGVQKGGVVVSGECGMGKTALLAHIGSIIPRYQPDAIVVTRFATVTPHSFDGFSLMRSVMMQLVTVLARGKGINAEVAELVARVQGPSKLEVPYADSETHLRQALDLLAGRPVYLVSTPS